MNAKVFLKIVALVFGLILVIYASKYFSSNSFHSSVESLFNNINYFQWCSYEKHKVIWLDPAINKKMTDRQQSTHKYCVVQMESIQGLDISHAQWRKVAQGFDSNGQVVFLEWDPATGVYRAAGLPFKSSILDQDLQPKP